jgi:UDP-N-acetylglucosamine 4,6-dehydratase/5-epimerase
MLKDKKILITGGTGSLGQALTKYLLNQDVETIRIFSRNESKQIGMESEFNDERLRFLIGDIRDLSRLNKALEDIDIVFHTAALKHVPVVEYNPFEAVQTNVIGSQNVIEACIQNNVETAVAIGTDKAVSPLNAYGSTKQLMEKLFITASNHINKNRHQTKFIALRYGNVLGSSGSVIPKWISSIKNNQKISITDLQMTRFSITMDDALKFIVDSTKMAKGSEIFVPKLQAYSISDIKEVINELYGNTDEEIIGIRSGEKLHEELISQDELRDTWEVDNRYVILQSDSKNEVRKQHENLEKPQMDNPYASNYAEKIPKSLLKELILKTFPK